jgi:hypothetical protein
MKALSLHQPWASLILFGIKKYETRSWETNYRGKLLICAAQKKGLLQKESYGYIRSKYLSIRTPAYTNLPFGVTILKCNLTECIKMTKEFIEKQSEQEIDCGDWTEGKYAWKLENIEEVPQIEVTGRQKLFQVNICV